MNGTLKITLVMKIPIPTLLRILSSKMRRAATMGLVAVAVLLAEAALVALAPWMVTPIAHT